MHNTKNQSWVKDNSKEYWLSLDDGTGTETAESKAGPGLVTSGLPGSLCENGLFAKLPILHLF